MNARVHLLSKSMFRTVLTVTPRQDAAGPETNLGSD